ncbi:polysaccharide deacetylase family protein [Rhizobium helianthi]|uniref:Polysaccharide deacetylase family protein n=1 Tax=Rhizobium helianthi TaxID=1132695 RepID=A0ABW4M3G3_9HYPH
MNETEWLRELDALAKAGKRLDFWLRDDDAVAVTPALERLLSLVDAQGVPLTLAVIPEKTGFPLAEHLQAYPSVSVAVHGWSHESFSRPPAKKQELGDERPLAVVLNEIQAGLQKLKALHGQRFQPVMVPPWNRISDRIADSLPGLGYAALSVFGREKAAGLPLINTHVDIIDWKGSRGGRDPEAVYADLLAYARQPGLVLGILTHHLVHDDMAWSVLERILMQTKEHPACRWLSLGDLLNS